MTKKNNFKSSIPVFTAVPVEPWTRTKDAHAIALLYYLCDRIDVRTGCIAWPSLITIRKDLGWSKTTITKKIDILVQVKLIKCIRGNRVASNTYEPIFSTRKNQKKGSPRNEPASPPSGPQGSPRNEPASPPSGLPVVHEVDSNDTHLNDNHNNDKVPPTLEQVKNYVIDLGIFDEFDYEKYFDKRNAIGWIRKDEKQITCWKSDLRCWYRDKNCLCQRDSEGNVLAF